MARGEPARPGAPLPAPYRNPWSGLAEALRAVVADLRLKLQRLWRRNREGDLPLPGFWPRDLAPLFWPLLLALILALVLGLGSRLLGLPRPSQPPLAPPAAGPPERAEPSPASEIAAGERREGAADPQAADPVAALEPQASTPGPAPEANGPGRQAADPGRSAASDAGAAAAAAPELRLDPLLELLSQGEGAGLLLAARPDPAGSRLSLTLSERAGALPQAELLDWAQRWQQVAREEGYEQLELRDRQGRLRGRGALVGSGMILLAPVPAA